MASKEEEISIIGVSGLEELLSSHTKLQSVPLTVNLVPKLYQFGKVLNNLQNNKTDHISPQSYLFMKGITVSLEH